MFAPMAARSADAMAKITVVVITDDLEGSTIEVSTYKFGFLGRHYEIDLGPTSFKAFEAALAPCVRAGRHRSRHTTSNQGHDDRGDDPAELRVWAAANSIVMGSRGRIPNAIVEQFKARSHSHEPSSESNTARASVAEHFSSRANLANFALPHRPIPGHRVNADRTPVCPWPCQGPLGRPGGVRGDD